MYAHVHMHSSLHVHTRLAGIVLIKARLTTITLYVCDIRIRLLLMFKAFLVHDMAHAHTLTLTHVHTHAHTHTHTHTHQYTMLWIGISHP